jgi:hypothetical protein
MRVSLSFQLFALLFGGCKVFAYLSSFARSWGTRGLFDAQRLQSAFSPELGTMPATSSVFFNDNEAIVPSRFADMRQWSDLRDFLSFFGTKYENSSSVANGVYVDRRHYAHRLAVHMTSIENDYGSIDSDSSRRVRLFCEGALAFFTPPEGWPRERAMVGIVWWL